jgi:hypothetical protein
MDKLERAHAMQRIAARMRLQALETALPEYQGMLRRTADTLDTEAEWIAKQYLIKFSRALQARSDSQLRPWYH